MSAYSSEMIAYMATALIIYFTTSRAAYLGLLDRPSSRKIHNDDIPVIGGIAIFFGFIASLFTLNIPEGRFQGFILPAMLMACVGLIDDMHPISYKVRFILQIVIGFLMTVWGGVVIYDLGYLIFEDSELTLDVLSAPFTIICLIGVVNAINMADGLDGLAGMLTLVALISLATVTYVGGQQELFQILLLLACSLIAFIGFNARFPWRNQAIVFMGDAGSMFLGFSLTWFTVSLSQGENAVMTPVTPLWFIALPLFDMTATMLRRLIHGRSPFGADCEHLHHVFLLAGFSVGCTVAILSVIAFLFAMIGIAGLYLRVPENIMFYTFLILFGVYFLSISHTWKVMRFLGRSTCRRTQAGSRRCGRDRRQDVELLENIKFGGVDRRSGMDRRKITDRRFAKSGHQEGASSSIKHLAFRISRRSIWF